MANLEKAISVMYKKKLPKLVTLENSLKEMMVTEQFEKRAIPRMAQKALEILSENPEIPLLLNQKSITLSKQQCFQFLSLMFFGLIDKQCLDDYKFPANTNFETLLWQGQCEKLKCFIKYFLEASKEEYENEKLVKFSKLRSQQNMQELQKQFKSSIKPLSILEFQSKKNEDHPNCTIVDFADMLFGGKTIACRGCAQEEIILLINPEGVIGSLFTSKLRDDEALLIEEVYQFSNYQGYEDSFKYISCKYQDKGQSILAIDALYLHQFPHNYQWSIDGIMRELIKAYVGVSGTNQIISTGKWGCGLFGGDKELKTIIQWLAFSEANMKENKIIINSLNDNAYFQLQQRFKLIRERYVTVGNLANELFQCKVNKNLISHLLR